MKIAICDDEQVQIEVLSKYVKDWCRDKDEPCILKTFLSAEEFLFEYEDSKDYHILLLDIQMKEMNGMELAKKLRSGKEEVQIIFITGVKDYVFDGYAVDAVSYLLKPIKASELMKCLNRAFEKCKKEEKTLLIEDNGEISKVKIFDIYYVDSNGHDTYIHLRDIELRNRIGIKKMEEKLVLFGFFRIHRSYLVNIARIERITKQEVAIDNGFKLPIARGKWEELNRVYLDFYRKKLS